MYFTLNSCQSIIQYQSLDDKQSYKLNRLLKNHIIIYIDKRAKQMSEFKNLMPNFKIKVRKIV